MNNTKLSYLYLALKSKINYRYSTWPLGWVTIVRIILSLLQEPQNKVISIKLIL